MSPFGRVNTYRTPHRRPWRRRFSAALPWLFVLAVAAGTMLPVRHWVHWRFPHAADSPADSQAARDAEMIWKRAGNSDVHHPVDVIRTVDGDTLKVQTLAKM